jgi:HemY protein
MKRFFWLLIVIVVAVILGLLTAFAPGFVLLQIGHTSYATPLWLAVLALIVLFVAFYVVWRLLYLLVSMPRVWRHYRTTQVGARRQKLLLQSLNNLLVEDWQKAERNFKKLAELDFMRRQTLLLAARCADHQGRRDAQINYLHQANALEDKGSKSVSDLSSVEVLIKDERLDEAKPILEKIVKKSSRNQKALELLLDVNSRLEHFGDAMDTLDKLKKCLDDDAVVDVAVKLYVQRFTAAQQKDIDTLEKVWSSVTADLRDEAPVVAGYALGLVHFERSAEAEKVIRKTLSNHWHEDLFALYGTMAGKDAKAQLSRAKAWCENMDPTDANLLALGRLSMRVEDFESAKRYIERAIGVEPTRAAHTVLAEVLTHLGDEVGAKEQYKLAAEL